MAGFFTSECQQEILSKTRLCGEGQKQSLEEIILHLSWGDITTSLFFMQELIDIVRARRGQVDMLEFQLRLLDKLLTMNDSAQLTSQRLDYFLRFNESNLMSYSSQ